MFYGEEDEEETRLLSAIHFNNKIADERGDGKRKDEFNLQRLSLLGRLRMMHCTTFGEMGVMLVLRTEHIIRVDGCVL